MEKHDPLPLLRNEVVKQCATCPHNGADGCDLTPSQITDAVCLLRHIAYQLNMLVWEGGDDDDGEEDTADWWK